MFPIYGSYLDPRISALVAVFAVAIITAISGPRTFRSADFFMRVDDADRKNAREKFLEAVRSVYGLDQHEHHAIPYTVGGVEGFLPAYRFTPTHSKGTIVFIGGFDSYIAVGNYGLALRTIVNWLDGMQVQAPDEVSPPTDIATARLASA